MQDLILAILHHLAVFSLVALLAMEHAALLSTPVRPARLATLDRAYGASAMLVLAVGASRLALGGKGWSFYADNPFFWGKMGAFLIIGLLSIGPSRTFLRWRRSAAGPAGFQPPQRERVRAQRWIGLQALMLAPLLACAAAMARWPF